MSERDQFSAKYDGCTKDTQSLKQQLESLRVEAEQNHQVHTDTHQMKDTKIQQLEIQVKDLADQLHAQMNVNMQQRQQQQQTAKETQTVNSDGNVPQEPPRQTSNDGVGNSKEDVQQNSPVKKTEGTSKTAPQEQQKGIPSKQTRHQSPDVHNDGNVRITDLSGDQQDGVAGHENKPSPKSKPRRGRKKKAMGMLKEHMGIHAEDEDYQ